MEHGEARSSAHYQLPCIWLISGLALLLFTFVMYVAFWNEFMGGTDNSAVFASLLTLVGASMCFGISGVSFLRQAGQTLPNLDPKSRKVSWSPSKVIADAFFQNRKIMILASITYAFFFAVIDAIIIYQPEVDFGKNYGVSGFESASMLSCRPSRLRSRWDCLLSQLALWLANNPAEYPFDGIDLCAGCLERVSDLLSDQSVEIDHHCCCHESWPG